MTLAADDMSGSTGPNLPDKTDHVLGGLCLSLRYAQVPTKGQGLNGQRDALGVAGANASSSETVKGPRRWFPIMGGSH